MKGRELCTSCLTLETHYKIDLELSETPPPAFDGMMVLHEKRVESHYEVDHHRLLQCQLCETYYS